MLDRRDKGVQMAKKDLFINSVQLVEVDGSANVPTVLYYKRKGFLIGSEAIARASNLDQLNEDFKIDLGQYHPTSAKVRARFPTAGSDKKSAAELTADFLGELLRRTDTWMDISALAGLEGTSVLLAEPLSLESELAGPDWLSNYRKNVQRILAGKGFETVDFLPEPFAVFQYYRYGLKHPLIAQRTKHFALVIDIGGGTCDVCIIETTREGDISRSGKNSRPLAAASQPIGGFYFNRKIAESLIRKLPLPSAQRGKALKLYTKWRKGDDDLSTAAQPFRDFVRHFHSLVYRVEDLKLGLCRSITDWRLNSNVRLNHAISVPSNPFSSDPEPTNISFSAADLRRVFVEELWKPYIGKTIQLTLSRAHEDLGGAAVSVVLLSGGSANIGWLEELVKDEFHDALKDAELLTIQDYQEVVAKGLALECARRFYTEEGDFSSTTYNRLCLILEPDNKGCESRPFVPKTDSLPDVRNVPGLLLPSASALGRFIDKPMRWRVKLKRPPRRQLDYYFLRSSFDPGDLQNLQNVESHTVFSPPNCTFDAAMQVQLQVKEDGTASPTFIYKEGRAEGERIAVEGKKFYVDMTYGGTEGGAKTYLGLDFGTSNSSVSFVSRAWINAYERRSGEDTWKDLGDLVNTLPYPLALPLARYIGQTDESRLMFCALEFVEAALALAAYSVYSEYCLNKGRAETKLLKNCRQRAAGYLWAFLQQVVKQVSPTSEIAAPFRELIAHSFREVDQTVTTLAKSKHGKIDPSSVDTTRPVQILANACHRAFAANRFGFFENVHKGRFATTYKGLFRHAHGKPPFTDVSDYEGALSFSGEQAVLGNLESGRVLLLAPLVFWDSCAEHPDSDEHCYFFDGATDSEKRFSFKAAGYPCSKLISDEDQTYTDLAIELADMRKADLQTNGVLDGRFM